MVVTGFQLRGCYMISFACPGCARDGCLKCWPRYENWLVSLQVMHCWTDLMLALRYLSPVWLQAMRRGCIITIWNESSTQWRGRMLAHTEQRNSMWLKPPKSIWDADGVIHVDYLPRGTTRNGQYHPYWLLKLRDAIKAKHHGKLQRGAFFQQDNAPVHTNQIAMRCYNSCSCSPIVLDNKTSKTTL